MKTLLIAATATATAAVATLAAGSASAQMMPNMDMSWGIAAQANAWNQGNQNAMNAANAYMAMMNQLRAQGYTGPSLPTGVTPESLQASIRGANDATQRYIQGSQANSAAQSFAVRDHGMRATRGCYWARDIYGNVGYACP